MTRLQISDLVRATLGELDSKKIEQGLLNAYINFGQRKVQLDLNPELGMKTFTKEGVLYGSTPSIPTDLLMTNDSIIKIKSGIGVKASGTLIVDAETPNEYNITITALNAGSIWNYTLEIRDDDAKPLDYSLSGTTITVKVNITSGLVTTNDIVNMLNNISIPAGVTAVEGVYDYFTFTTTTANVKPITVGSITLTTGANPTAYYPSREMTIEEYIDMPYDTYNVPTITTPRFVRRGDTSASQTIQFLPNTINYSVIYYRYKSSDLTTDTSVLTLPSEYEELLIDKIMVKCYEVLKANAESQAKQVEYATKLSEYENSYLKNRNQVISEKNRLNTN